MATVPAATDDVIMCPRKPTSSSGPRQVEVMVGRGHRESGGRERNDRAVGMATFNGVGVGVAGVVSSGKTQRLVSARAEPPY